MDEDEVGQDEPIIESNDLCYLGTAANNWDDVEYLNGLYNVWDQKSERDSICTGTREREGQEVRKCEAVGRLWDLLPGMVLAGTFYLEWYWILLKWILTMDARGTFEYKRKGTRQRTWWHLAQ